MPSGFRLVDTSLNSIVERAGQVDYVALTYCWSDGTGKTPHPSLQLKLHNVNQLSQENGLDVSKLPPVLADAIQMCRDFGKRYLWIDQLCIIQDDPASKFSQIAAMDRIYKMADFTIVALGSSPGLPGVSSRPRDTTLSAVHGLWDGGFRPGSFSEAYFPIADWAIGRSRWNTRGWTFQERKLSRRLVLIDRQHAYFSCFQGSFWEHDLRAFNTRHDDLGRVPFGTLGSIHVTSESFSKYARIAVEYSKRQLSFRSDVLNAFTGVGTTLSSLYHTSLLYGLLERYLFQSLLWKPDDFTRSQVRDDNLDIPSWSWAAWDGAVDYGFTDSLEFRKPEGSFGEYATDSFKPWHGDEVGSLVTFFYSDHSRIVRRVNEGRWWFTGEEIDDDEFAERLEEWRQWRAGETYDNHGLIATDAWDRCCHSPVEALRHVELDLEAHAKAAATAGCLAFTTTCAHLTLRPTMHNHDLSSLAVYFDMYTTPSDNTPAVFVGQTMLMQRNWAQRTFDLGRSYCVIVLAAGEASKASERSHAWEKLASGPNLRIGLYVMITEQTDGVMYRLAIGVADVLAWNAANPTWQSVVLA